MCFFANNEEENNENCSSESKLPIIYCSNYSVKFCGLEKLHPFDASKGKHIYEYLKTDFFFNNNSIHKPKEISKIDLLKVHTSRYINSLKWSFNVAKIAEIPPLIFVPNYFVQRGYLRPMRYQAGGSLMAAELALQQGWAINLGGGFHHCSADEGGGFCPYADITLMVQLLLKEENGIKKIMIVDLDAHQGNGYERDLINENNVFIIDMFNIRIYPKDMEAKKAIKNCIELKPFTKDKEYLSKLRQNLKQSMAEFQPDFIIYNAGTDILSGDPLGRLSVSPKGVIERDEFVFSSAVSHKIPIVMLLSGGYLRSSARVIADSIINLNKKGLLFMKI